jgi:3-oxoadipate enol-lactonase
VHYIGLSIGGMLGQALAIHHGSRVLSAMWCDTTPATPAGSKATWADRMATVKKAGSLEPMADQTMERWFSDAWRPRHPARWKEIRGTIAGTTPAGYMGCAAAIMNFDFTGELAKLKLPVLVICGSDDAGTPPAANKQIASLVPGGRYEEIATARHFPNVEFPDQFNTLMMGWLGKHR